MYILESWVNNGVSAVMEQNAECMILMNVNFCSPILYASFSVMQAKIKGP